MLCSACSTDVLNTFLRSFSIQSTCALKHYGAQPSLRRLVHTKLPSHFSHASSRSLDYEVTGVPPSPSLDNINHSFEGPEVKSTSLRARKPRAPIFSGCNLVPNLYSSTGSEKPDTLHLGSSMQQNTSLHDPATRTRNSSQEDRVLHAGSAEGVGFPRAHLDKAFQDTPLKGSIAKIRQVSSHAPSYDSPEAKRQRKTSREAAQLTLRNGERTQRPREPWQIQKQALREKFGETGWAPRKRLSPDALDGIRALHAQYPEQYTTEALANQFKVSPEAIRRILKSKWRPNEEEDVERRQRWLKRGENIWTQMVELGVKPPKKWREMGVGKPPELRTERHRARGRASLSEDGESISVYDELMEAHKDTPNGKGHPGRALSDIIL